MKKLLFIAGFVLSFSALSPAFSIEASEMEPVNDEPIQTEIELEVEEEGDGVNDPSTVDIQVTRISDENLLNTGQESPTSYLANQLITTYGAGEWDSLGSSTFKSNSKVFYSGGGNIKIHIYQPYIGSNFSWKYQLREQDPMFHDTIKSWEHPNKSGTYEVILSVGSYVDDNGQAGKAELYVKKLTVATTSVTSYWWD